MLMLSVDDVACGFSCIVVVVFVAPVDAAFDAAADAVFPYILRFIPDLSYDLCRIHY
jgi:hypothetical protein